jgi:transcriptional regulator with XRE-family HTH domain
VGELYHFDLVRTSWNLRNSLSKRDMMAKQKPIPNHFLRQARELKKLTQRELAEELGTTVLSIGRWERGRIFPSAYFRNRLCEFFDTSAEDLGLIRERYENISDEDEEADNIMAELIARLSKYENISDEDEDEDEEADLPQTPTDHEQEQKVIANGASPDLEVATRRVSKQPSFPDQESQEHQLMPPTPRSGKAFISKYKLPISILSLLTAVVIFVYTLTRIVTPTPTPTPIPRISNEAESSQNTWTGFAGPVSCSSCSGEYRICCLSTQSNGQNGTLQFNNVNKSIAGSYTMTIYYTEGDPGSRTGYVSVNGGAAIAFTGVYTGSWGTVETVKMTISLNAGNNTIKFFNPNGPGPDIDRIVV